MEVSNKQEQQEIMHSQFIAINNKLKTPSNKWTVNISKITNLGSKLLVDQGKQKDLNPTINADIVINSVIGKTIVLNIDKNVEEDVDHIVHLHHLHLLIAIDQEEKEENLLKKQKKDTERDHIHHQAVVHRIVVQANHHPRKNNRKEINRRNRKIKYLIDPT